VVLNNAGTSPVSGTFSGRPEGSVIRLNAAYDFRLSYVGGDGNDVVLISLNGKNPTNTTLVSSQNPSAPGQAVTFTATVSGGQGTPTGTVRFRSGSDVLGTSSLVGNTATFTTTALAVGTNTITAQYLGDVGNGGSTSPPLLQTVSAEGVTPPGPDQQVDLTTTIDGAPVTVNVVFQNVVSGGQTTLTVPPSVAPPPEGFQFGNPPLYFDVSTTASFSGSVLLCFSWAEGRFSNENAVGLWHFEGGQWVNVTTELDTAANVVCGVTTSLSPFALLEVRFAFGGFLLPVRSFPEPNTLRAGASLPVKFSLGGDRGLGIFAAGYPASAAVGCQDGNPTGPWAPTMTPGGSSLAYDPMDDRYQYVWKTDKAWAQTCRQFMIRFTDGTAASFRVDFR
jgi:hypothetical protein